MKKPKQDRPPADSLVNQPVIKTTIRVYKKLWDNVRIRAIEESTSAEDIVARALVKYLQGTRVVRLNLKKGDKS